MGLPLRYFIGIDRDLFCSASIGGVARADADVPPGYEDALPRRRRPPGAKPAPAAKPSIGDRRHRRGT